jgi:glycosyltransferase involved in cell wall biosynthesis
MVSILNVLLVSYSFPPLGGTGVMRASSFARYFPNEGIRLDVLTALNASAVGSDRALLKEIPGDVTVHRTITLDLPFGIKKRIKKLVTRSKVDGSQAASSPRSRILGLLKRVVQMKLQPDPQVTWLPMLTRTARRVIKNRHIDVVIITVPPFSSVLLVERLRKEFPDLAIVVDFRDEWLTTTFDLVSFLFTSNKDTRNIAQHAEASAIANSTAVVAVTEAARREIRARYPDECDEKFHLIANGFDAKTIRKAESSRKPRHDSKIIVTYIGTLYASTDPTTVIRALQILPPEVKGRFIFRFIGHIEEPRIRESLLEMGEIVELKGYLPQHQALAAMNGTDYVLLINHDPLNVGGKFYDYVGAAKPILGAVHPEGETRRLLEELQAGWWAGSRDIEGICKLFVDAAARVDSLNVEFRPDTEKIQLYERRSLARRYAALLHSIARRSPESGAQVLTPEMVEVAG